MPVDTAHILVVDDDQRLRDLLDRFLTDNGYNVTTAGDADEARASLRGLRFDALVLDRMMPGEDGLCLARDLRTHDATPILLLTAMGEPDERIAGLESGVDDYLVKPFEPRELLLRLGNILRRAANDGPGERKRGDQRSRRVSICHRVTQRGLQRDAHRADAAAGGGL